MKDALKFINYMDKHLIVSNWAWETNEFNYGAYGSGSVKNNTIYSLSKVKYIITYTTKNGTEVTEDSGIVTYDRIRPHGSASFSFYTPYVGNAKYASIRLEIDPMFMFKKLAEGDVPF